VVLSLDIEENGPSSYDRPPELDDESRATSTTNKYECYSSSQCFNTTITDFSPADQNIIRCGVQPVNNISGPAPNTGMSVCYAPPVETGPRNKGGELLEPPILTTNPQILNAWSPYGGVELEGRKKSTVCELICVAIGAPAQLRIKEKSGQYNVPI